jgi:hypothetical protein
VTVVVSGIRKGHPGRFARMTEGQMRANARFWNQWKQS